MADARNGIKDEGWAAFERAVDAAVKSGPKHKKRTESSEKPVKKTGRPEKPASPR
jgi:hypothetical protein